MALALIVVSCDLHDVFAVGGDEIGVGVRQFLTHPLGVFDVHAEDDGLGEAVAAFEELGDLLRDELACAPPRRGAGRSPCGCRCGPRRACRPCPLNPFGGRQPSASMSRSIG